MPVPKVGRIISSIRMRRGYSQEYVAFNLDISQKTFSRIEQNGDSLSLAKLKKISQLLDFDLVRLISFYIEDKQKPAEIETLSNIVDKICNRTSNCISCPFEKKVQNLEIEVEKLKNELSQLSQRG